MILLTWKSVELSLVFDNEQHYVSKYQYHTQLDSEFAAKLEVGKGLSWTNIPQEQY